MKEDDPLKIILDKCDCFEPIAKKDRAIAYLVYLTIIGSLVLVSALIK